MFDTIVAPITGSPPAAVAWLRLSGPDAWRIASCIARPWPKDVEPRKAWLARYSFGEEGLVLPFEQGHSYTGETSVELSIHGSRASINLLMDACLQHGARTAEPGEFTLRAFLNGKIDLTQAEGIRESCEALTSRQLRLAHQLRSGKLRQEVSAIRTDLIGLLAALEASVDFSEEIGEFDGNAAAVTLHAAEDRIESLLAGGNLGRIIREGYRIAIVGLPNAGKSSLLNAILGIERSIVTDTPGTTRDYVEERVDFDGVPLVLIDTAGMRETADPVESIGVQRAIAISAGADLVWYVYDAVNGWTEADEDNLKRLPKAIVVANKADLASGDRGIPISSLTGRGVPELLRSTVEALGVLPDEPLINARHAALLRSALGVLREFGRELYSEAPDDLLSVLLSEAISWVGQVTGETASPDMVHEIFHGFCVGK